MSRSFDALAIKLDGGDEAAPVPVVHLQTDYTGDVLLVVGVVGGAVALRHAAMKRPSAKVIDIRTRKPR